MVFILEPILEFVVEVLCRFLGVTVLAVAARCRRGLRGSLRAEWTRIFDAHAGGGAGWVDLLGLAVLVLPVAALILFAYLA